MIAEFMENAKDGDLGSVQTILEENPFLIDIKDDDGMSALHWAAYEGHPKLVDYLINNKADVHAYGYRGRSVLMMAAQHSKKDNTKIIEALINAGANVNDVSDHEDEASALHLAIGSGHVANVLALINNDAQVEKAMAGGFRPIHSAIDGNNSELKLDILIQSGASVNVQNDQGWTPLMLATFLDQPKTIRHLHQCGASLRTIGRKGETAMDIAKALGRDKVVALLMQLDMAMPRIKPNRGSLSSFVALETT